MLPRPDNKKRGMPTPQSQTSREKRTRRTRKRVLRGLQESGKVRKLVASVNKGIGNWDGGVLSDFGTSKISKLTRNQLPLLPPFTTTETSSRGPQTRGIAGDGDLLKSEGDSLPSKIANSSEGMPASREVMSTANAIDYQEESDRAVIEVYRELKEGVLPVVEGDSELVASRRPR